MGQSSELSETLFGVGKLAVWLPFQPAGFYELSSEPVLAPDPVSEPELCSFSLLFLQDILSDGEFLVNREPLSPWFAVERRSSLYNSLVEQVPKFIPGCFS